MRSLREVKFLKKGKLTRFAIVLALLSLTGCGNAAESNETNTEVKVDSETEEITETEITPNLPDDLDLKVMLLRF